MRSLRKVFYVIFGVVASIVMIFIALVLVVYGGLLMAIIKPISVADSMFEIVGKMQKWIDSKIE